MQSIPAGWYPDPDDDGVSLRWWDGDDWTERTRSASAPQRIPGPRPTPGLRGAAADVPAKYAAELAPQHPASTAATSEPVQPAKRVASTDSAHRAQDTKGFLGSLFDFGFRHFITLKFLKIIYVLLLGVIALVTVLLVVFVATQGGLYILLGLVAVPAVALVILVFTRIGLELIAVVFRIGESTSALAATSAEVPAAGTQTSTTPTPTPTDT